MYRLLLLWLAVAGANAIVCLPNMCATVRCAAVTAETCVGGTIVPNGGFCGCCDACVHVLSEGQQCFDMLLLGVPPTSRCAEGLYCDPATSTCKSLSAKRQVLVQSQTCAQRLAEIQQAQTNGLPLVGQFVPRCDPDGSYSARQCHGSSCYCVDPYGNKIQDYHGQIGDANMDCQCARDQYNYLQTGLIGRLFYCDTNGSYRHYACTGSVCYCTDTSGNIKLGSPTVSIGDLASLQC